MKSTRQQLWVALVALALGASLLHFRIHPPDELSDVWPNLFSWLDLVVVSLLFTTRRTAVYGYVLNGMLVIFGTVLMAHLSIVKLAAEPPQPFYLLLFKSTLPDIGLAWADFLVGAALYYTWLREPVEKKG